MKRIFYTDGHGHDLGYVVPMIQNETKAVITESQYRNALKKGAVRWQSYKLIEVRDNGLGKVIRWI